MTPEQILAIAASVNSNFATDVVPYYKEELLKFAELLLASAKEEAT